MIADRLFIMLTRIRRLLSKHEDTYWLPTMKDLTDQAGISLEAFRTKVSEALFSGGPMGNFSDLTIMKVNGHKVENERETNFELAALRAVLFEEVKYDVHGEEAKRPIKHFGTYPITHAEWEVKLTSDIPEIIFGAFTRDPLEVIFDVLVWITFYHSDWRWEQDWCLHFTEHSNSYVRGLAATCLADLARLHRALDTGKVIPRLQQLLNDPDVEVRERAEETLRDINSVLGVFS